MTVVAIRAKVVGRAFLVEHRGILTLVDTGTSMSESRVLSALRRMGRKPEDVRQIVISHSHGDHAGGGARMRELCGAPVIVGAADVATIEGREPYKYAPSPWNRAAFSWLDRYPRYAPDRTISEREELDGGLLAIPSPGHTPGHLAFYAPDHRFLFAGDSLWNLGRPTLDWKGFAQDWRRSHESARELSTLAIETAFVGHGPPIRDARRRIRDLVSPS